MAMDLNTWIDSYQPTFEEVYKEAEAAPLPKSQMFAIAATAWAEWLTNSSVGAEVTPPYNDSKGTFSAAAFGTPTFGPDAASTAATMAAAWASWFLASSWTTPPPAGPFSAIASVIPSPSGTIAAQATLQAALTAEFAILPSNPATAFDEKATAFGNMFYTATTTAGVDITGTSGGDPLTLFAIPIQ